MRSWSPIKSYGDFTTSKQKLMKLKWKGQVKLINISHTCLRVEIAPHLKELQAISDVVENLAAIAIYSLPT